MGASYQRLIGHVSLVLQLQQPPLQLVPRSLCLLAQLLLPLQTPPLHLDGAHSNGSHMLVHYVYNSMRGGGADRLNGPSVVSRHQHLFPRPLLSGLRLHLLHLQRVQPPAAHKQVVVPNAQLEDLHQSQSEPAAVSTSSSPGPPAGFRSSRSARTHQLVDPLPRGVELEDVCFLIQRLDGELSRADTNKPSIRPFTINTDGRIGGGPSALALYRFNFP